MRWGAQVGHVFAKDVRYARWGIAAFAVLIVLSVLRAFAGPGNSYLSSATPSVILAMLGVALTASIVQADGATVGTAFWPSRPFFPSAILGSKSLFALVLIVGAPLVGQALAMRAFHMEMRETLSLISSSAIAFGACILLAVNAAALTNDLPSFGLAYIALLMFIFVVPMMAASYPRHDPTAIGMTVAAALCCVSDAVLLLMIYRRRVGRRVGWLCVFGLQLLGWMIARVVPSPARTPAPPFEMPRVNFEIYHDPRLSGSDQARLRVSAEGQPRDIALAIALDSLVIHPRSGKILRARGFLLGSTIQSGMFPIQGGVVPVGNAALPIVESLLEAGLTPDEKPITVAQIATIDVFARLIASRPVLLGEVAAGQTRDFQGHGMRIRLSDALVTRDSAAVRMEMRSFKNADVQYSYGRGRVDRPAVVLVNPAAREALLLRENATGADNGWYVVPGVDFHLQSASLTLARTAGDGSYQLRDSTWFQGAHFAVYDWEHLGIYPVHQTVDVRAK